MSEWERESFEDEVHQFALRKRALRGIKDAYAGYCSSTGVSKDDLLDSLRQGEKNLRDTAGLLIPIEDLPGTIEEFLNELGLRRSPDPERQSKREIVTGLLAQGFIEAGRKDLAIKTMRAFIRSEDIFKKVRNYIYFTETAIDGKDIVPLTPFSPLTNG